jgi:hypothetical protein
MHAEPCIKLECCLTLRSRRASGRNYRTYHRARKDLLGYSSPAAYVSHRRTWATPPSRCRNTSDGDGSSRPGAGHTRLLGRHSGWIARTPHRFRRFRGRTMSSDNAPSGDRQQVSAGESNAADRLPSSCSLVLLPLVLSGGTTLEVYQRTDSRPDARGRPRSRTPSTPAPHPRRRPARRSGGVPA